MSIAIEVTQWTYLVRESTILPLLIVVVVVVVVVIIVGFRLCTSETIWDTKGVIEGVSERQRGRDLYVYSDESCAFS